MNSRYCTFHSEFWDLSILLYILLLELTFPLHKIHLFALVNLLYFQIWFSSKNFLSISQIPLLVIFLGNNFTNSLISGWYSYWAILSIAIWKESKIVKFSTILNFIQWSHEILFLFLKHTDLLFPSFIPWTLGCFFSHETFHNDETIHYFAWIFLNNENIRKVFHLYESVHVLWNDHGN